MTKIYIFPNHQFWQFLVVLLVLAITNGCVSLQPFPNAARSGDTITLAVGSADGMTSTNTTVDFYYDSDPSTPYSVPVRSVLKIYPDKTSAAWLSMSPSIPKRSSHGAWLSVVVVDIPSLTDGTGFFRVSSSVDVVYPETAANMIGVDVPFTILPGTGTSHPFNFAKISNLDGTGAGDDNPGELDALGPMPQAIIKPAVPAAGTATLYSYGAIEMDLTMPITALGGGAVPDDGIAVTLDDQPQNIANQTQLIWKRNGDSMKIMLISPKGMYSHEARVSVTPLGWVSGFGNVYQISGTPSLDTIKYYNLNGGLSTDPLPPLPTITQNDNSPFP